MTLGRTFRLIAGLALLMLSQRLLLADPVPTPPQRQARLKDVASIEGIRDNQLVGYGIVVGLNGTGDSQQTAFPTQTLAATLLRMGISVPANAIRVQNMAAVFISASLPPFARSGTRIDLTVSSAGDARSLEGGLLLMTPLYGSDGKIYAEAQGPLVLGGYSVAANGNSKAMNHPHDRADSAWRCCRTWCAAGSRGTYQLLHPAAGCGFSQCAFGRGGHQ